MPKKSVAGTKSVRLRKKRVVAEEPSYDFEKDVPDPNSNEYYQDEIDKFHDEPDENSSGSAHGYSTLPEVGVPSNEAVYDFSDSDSEEEMEERYRKIEARVRRHRKDDSGGEDVEDESNKNIKAWGKKRDDFYGADIGHKVDIGISSDDEEAEARMEEKEALLLQQKMVSQLDESDFGLESFKPKVNSHEIMDDYQVVEKQAIACDVSKMSKRDKLRILKKEYPELLNLLSEYKQQMVDYKERLLPLLQLYTTRQVPHSTGIELLKQKAKLVLRYCCSIQFYLLLRAEQVVVDGHPVVKRLVQLKQLLKEIEHAEEKLRPQTEYLLRMLSHKGIGDVKFFSATPSSKRVRIASPLHDVKQKAAEEKKMSTLLDSDPEETSDADVAASGHGLYETDGEREAARFYEVMKRARSRKANEAAAEVDMQADVEEWENVETSEVEKRAVTQQIALNKGAQTGRKKAKRNPRIKNRLKYQKATSIHRSSVPEVRRELSRYSGEASGIRASRIRSVKIKS